MFGRIVGVPVAALRDRATQLSRPQHVLVVPMIWSTFS
jgi:hypothetical protein